MYLASMHMINETIGWGAGEPRDHKDLMLETGEWSIFHTTDGGGHWQAVKTWGFSDITPFFLSETTAWVAFNHHLTRTSNTGTTWEVYTLPFAADESARIIHLTFLDTHTGWFIAQVYPASAPPKSAPFVTLYHTNDGGKHWSQLFRVSSESSSSPRMNSGITFLTATTGWMTSGSLLLTTRDEGRTWQPQPLPLPAGVESFNGLRLQAPRFFSAQDGIISASRSDPHASTPNGFVVFVTHDGGQNWQSQPFVIKDYDQIYAEKCRAMEEKRRKEAKSGESLRFYRDLAYRGTPAPQFADMQFGWVGLPGLEMSTTRDGGKHWEELKLPPMPQRNSRIQFINSRVGWSLTESQEMFSSRVYRTIDGGKTWTRLIPTVSSS